MPTDTKLNNLVINYLTQEQYDAIATPNENELYLTPDNSTGGASVSPCLNLIDMSGETPTIRTSITEEEKTNWDKQLYNSILYFDSTLGNVAALSAQFPENLSPSLQSFSTFIVSQNVDSSFSVKSISSYTMQIGEKSADGTYPIGIEKSIEAYFGDRDGVGIIKAPDTMVLTSEDGYNMLSNSNELVYAGWSNINGTGDALMLGLCPRINKTATGEQEYCSFLSMVVGHGIGELSLKKDSNNIPRAKSFTTWLPPVTSASEGKALIVTEGNAKWTTTPRYEHTITIKNSAGAILWTQTMRNSSNTIVNSYANLKTLFGEATYAGFGEYCQLDLHGGTEATDKLIKADGTEVTLASLGAIVYTDVCFLPK